MNDSADNPPGGARWSEWRENIIGLGEQSSRKSYYPELQRRLAELNASEAKLRAIFNSTHDAIVIHDFDGRVEEANDPMLALFRVPRERVGALTVADLTAPGPQLARLPQLFEEMREGGDQLFEWRCRRPLDGSEFEVEVSLRSGEWGNRRMLVAVVRDISERKRAEAERRRLEEELAQMRRMESIGRLAGGMAHDFNNMLTPILSYATMLRDELPADDERRADLGEVVRAAERARDLVRQLLAYSRRQTFALKPLDLGEMVRGFERMLRRVVREDIVLRLELAATPVLIHGDVGQIEQTLMNLVVNAQDAMPQGGTLRIGTAEVAEGGAQPFGPAGGSSVLWVEDTGTGMDEATRARIFEPFFTTKAVGKGSGLGLASAYGIVRQHEGQILVQSEVGRGTRFELHFPRYRGPVGGGAEAAADRGAASGGSGTILVVEDQDQVRLMLAKVLGRLGYRVVAAGGGEEALRRVEELGRAPDLLISDVVMPGLNGRDLYRHLRVQFPALPVLFISGYAPDMDASQGEVLAKPFNPAELAAKVKQLLAR